MPGRHPEPPSAQSPFARCGRYPQAARRPAPRQRTLLRLPRSYELMRRTKTLHPPRLCALSGWSSQVVVSPCWEMVLPDVISAVCVKAPGPIPRGSLWHYPFASPILRETCPEGVGQTYVSQGLAHRTSLPSNFVRERGFRGGSHSLRFRLPDLLDPPVAPTVAPRRSRIEGSAAGPFTSRNEHGVTLHEL